MLSAGEKKGEKEKKGRELSGYPEEVLMGGQREGKKRRRIFFLRALGGEGEKEGRPTQELFTRFEYWRGGRKKGGERKAFRSFVRKRKEGRGVRPSSNRL